MKLAFVAHEFGIFPSHGGIASYLFQIAERLLSDSPDFSIDVVCSMHGKTDHLIDKFPDRFRVHEIGTHPNMRSMLAKTRDILKGIKPDVVEVADYLGLAKFAALEKRLGLGFQETVFVTNHHTASQEIYEWCNEIKSSLGSPELRLNIMNERDQMHLSDANIAPSHFLARYAAHRYQLPAMPVFPYPYSVRLKSQATVRAENSIRDPDSAKRKFTIVLLSRFEPRKNQVRLVREFMQFLDSLTEGGESIEGIELHMAGNSVPMEIGGRDYREYVRSIVDPRFRDNIHFWDFLKLEQQDHLIAIADLAVMPSTFENFPVAMIETVLRGIPVMGSKHSGVADYSIENSDLLTFDPYRPGDLSNNLLSFYRTSKSARAAIHNQQRCELQRLLDPEVSVGARVEYFSDLRQQSKSISRRNREANTIFLEPDAPKGSQQLNSFFSCRDLVAELRRRDPSFKHASLVLLSGGKIPDRLRTVLTKGDLDTLASFALGITCDGVFNDLLDVLQGGHPVVLPFVARQTLEQADPNQRVFELFISEAMARTLVVDNSTAKEALTPNKRYTDFCFIRKNYALDQLVTEYLQCSSKPCSSTALSMDTLTEKLSNWCGSGPRGKMRPSARLSSAATPAN